MTREKSMHLFGRPYDLLPKLVIEDDMLARLRGAVEQKPFLYPARKHFLQTKRLGAQLHAIGVALLAFAPLILDRTGPPKAILPEKRMAFGILDEFDYVAFSRKAQSSRANIQPAHDQGISAPLSQSLVMRSSMHHVSHGRKSVFTPFPLDMNERPLPTAEREVLNTG